MAMKLYPSYLHPPSILPIRFNQPKKIAFCVRNFSSGTLHADNSYKLVLEVKERLKNEYHELPVGKNGRDDENMIYWFLKDRSFSVDDAVKRLNKAIKWRQEFGVAHLSEHLMKSAAQTGKSSVHDFLDVNGRPVLIVEASKHFPGMQDEDEKLCVFQIEKALSKLPEGQEQILGIIDLRGFGTANADMNFLTFLFDVFYYYYPKRLGQVLFVEAPFVFKPLWQLAKPLLKKHASLVRFCSAETVHEEYFTEETVPALFRNESTTQVSGDNQ
ncbi:phosphatidylinositol transfer protein CSR1-like isoform X1 [Amaranthus tricolor]|uniref:phosphatidylinositol transfer protein CSR1-like isoform X1 n=2 Tax=Amaranthus tricolor TaxID=29722 RepID=UPI002590A4A2|nr:phosphatidylinositol transfer protein CSR1-like isoform X1 [Amaranthus tricolor]